MKTPHASTWAFWKQQATEPNPHWPQAKRKTEKQIGICVDRVAKQERLNINDVDMSRPWSIRRIGGLRFEPSDRTHRYRGQLTHYQDKHGIEYGVKVDVPRKARGPEFLGSADQNDKDDMAKKGWEPLHPLMRKTRRWPLSGEEKAEQRANKDVPESQKCRDLYHRSRRGPRRLPVPYDVKWELPHPAYAP